MPTVQALVVGLIVLSGGFWLIERRRARNGARRTGADTRTDLIYWFFTPLVTRSVTRIALGIVFVLVARSQGVSFEEFRQLVVTRRTWASALPLTVQIPLLLLVGDLLAYWSHRLFHGAWLWPFHAVHHSSTSVDWLSSVRLHPVNDIVTRLLQVVPLYWMGFSGAALAGFVPFLTLYALVLHANVPWTYGPLRYVIASPAFHRWHHTIESEGLDKNFAGMFPFIDLVFGTFYMPRGRQPEHFGITGVTMPTGFLAQVAYPFRRRAQQTVRYDRAR